MGKPDVINDRNNSPEKDNRAWMLEEYPGFNGKAEPEKPKLIESPKNNAKKLPVETPGNKAIKDMPAGSHTTIDQSLMKQHPAEAAEGVHHMAVIKWDETTATKLGFDANDQLITTTMVYGSHPAPIERKLNDPKQLKSDLATSPSLVGTKYHTGRKAKQVAVRVNTLITFILSTTIHIYFSMAKMARLRTYSWKTSFSRSIY